MSFGDAPVYHDLHNNSRKCPRYGVSNNNIGESTGSMFSWSGSRSTAPPDCCVSVLKNNNERMEEFEEFFQPTLASDPKKIKIPKFLMKNGLLHNKRQQSARVGELHRGQQNTGKANIRFSICDIDQNGCDSSLHSHSSCHHSVTHKAAASV